MADTRHDETTKTDERRPAAESVDREPRGEPTPKGHGLPVEKEDEPKGQPTSDRFQSEQAHPDKGEDA